MYCPEYAFQLKNHDVEIWPGLQYQIQRLDLEDVPMLKIDIDYLAVRLETALEVIQDIKAEQMN